MPAYNADLERFAGFDAQVMGMSVDSIYSHIAWQKKDIGMMNYPLCADFYPHGEVAKAFDVFREGDPVPGINERAIFIVDKEGKIAFSQLYRLDEQPSNEELFEALKSINAKAVAVEE
jgi:alkyl hydroperoxide reductase subunit AhpC